MPQKVPDVPESFIFENNFWTYICGIACILRFLSYRIIPPGPDTLSAKSIETLVPYHIWAYWLLLVSVALLVGAVLHNVKIAFIAHLLATLTYSFFTYSLSFSIVQINFDHDPNTMHVGWAGVEPLAIVALLNAWRVRGLARDLNRSCKGGA